MKKKYIIITCFVILVFFICVYIYYFGEVVVLNHYSESYLESFIKDNIYTDENNPKIINGSENIVKNEETAIAIGKAVLKEHFTSIYGKIKNNITVRDMKDVWLVYDELKTSRNNVYRHSIKNDSVIYAIIKKNSGEIIKVGIGI